MTRDMYLAISTCLHVVGSSFVCKDHNSPSYDKLHKIRWVLDEFRERCKENWNLGQEITIDEMMVPYKGKYCHVIQHLPSKLVKWGLKVWCLMDARSKYVSTFNVHAIASRGEGALKGSKGRFTLQWRSALFGQEFSPKTWLFKVRDGMPEKMKRQ